MPKKITRKQQRFLFSKGSPLTKKQKKRLAGELRSGKSRVVSKKRGRKR